MQQGHQNQIDVSWILTPIHSLLSNTRLISRTGKVVNIHGFTNGVELKNVPLASIATVFVDIKGNRILLVVHQALYLGAKHAGCLVNPNQI
jgi:hypothetical protein